MEMKGTYQELSLTAPIAEEDQVVALLGSLPLITYSTLVTALETRDVISLSYCKSPFFCEQEKFVVFVFHESF